MFTMPSWTIWDFPSLNGLVHEVRCSRWLRSLRGPLLVCVLNQVDYTCTVRVVNRFGSDPGAGPTFLLVDKENGPLYVTENWLFQIFGDTESCSQLFNRQVCGWI